MDHRVARGAARHCPRPRFRGRSGRICGPRRRSSAARRAASCGMVSSRLRRALERDRRVQAGVLCQRALGRAAAPASTRPAAEAVGTGASQLGSGQASVRKGIFGGVAPDGGPGCGRSAPGGFVESIIHDSFLAPGQRRRDAIPNRSAGATRSAPRPSRNGWPRVGPAASAAAGHRAPGLGRCQLRRYFRIDTEDAAATRIVMDAPPRPGEQRALRARSPG